MTNTTRDPIAPSPEHCANEAQRFAYQQATSPQNYTVSIIAMTHPTFGMIKVNSEDEESWISKGYVRSV